MRRVTYAAASLALGLLLVACGGASGGGVVVTAPVSRGGGDASGGAPRASSVAALPAACSSTWSAEQVASAGQAVLTCGTAIERVDLDPASEATRAVLAGLEAARDRVCACAARLTPPASVELTVRVLLHQGRATAALTEDEDVAVQDATTRAFAECVGAASAAFAPTTVRPCTDPTATLDYPIGFPLGP